MSEQEFIKELSEIGLKLTSESISKLNRYNDFLLEYNTHTNLTAIKTKEEVYLKHFYDSLTLTKVVNLERGTLLDVGTGAGFPGLVLGIVFPNLEVTLLDSNNKKIEFLNKCIKLLDLKNVKTVYERAEKYTSCHREEYDYVTSRAVAELRILIELNTPALKVNGLFIAMKANIDEELSSSQNTLKKLNCTVDQKIEFDLPNNAGHRTILTIKKNSKTDLIYPREYSKIKKHALLK